MSYTLKRHNDKWTPEPNTGCYIWTGYTTGTRGARPNVRVGGRGGKNKYVARLVCEETYGPPFDGAEAAHKGVCVGNLCVNPDHMYWATRSQNEMDKSPEMRKRISLMGVTATNKVLGIKYESKSDAA